VQPLQDTPRLSRFCSGEGPGVRAGSSAESRPHPARRSAPGPARARRPACRDHGLPGGVCSGRHL